MKTIRNGLIYQRPIPRKSFQQMQRRLLEEIKLKFGINSRRLPTQAFDIEIGLLIEANCAKALEPPSKDGGPFSFKSPLGW